MDSRGLRIVGFTFSGHGESTLNAEVSNAKLQTQRSLLSELLSRYADISDSRSDDSDSYDDVEGEEHFVDAGVEPTPVERQENYPRSSPISIPYTESLANQRAQDAYRRLLYQRRVEQLYYQQQQQMQYQAQQQYLLQRQMQMRRLQYMQGIPQPQQQEAQPVHPAGQETDEGVHACVANPVVPLF